MSVAYTCVDQHRIISTNNKLLTCLTENKHVSTEIELQKTGVQKQSLLMKTQIKRRMVAIQPTVFMVLFLSKDANEITSIFKFEVRKIFARKRNTFISITLPQLLLIFCFKISKGWPHSTEIFWSRTIFEKRHKLLKKTSQKISFKEHQKPHPCFYEDFLLSQFVDEHQTPQCNQ